MQCRHVVGIAPAQAGKTLSYLPAVLTLLLQSSSYSKLPPGVHVSAGSNNSFFFHLNFVTMCKFHQAEFFFVLFKSTGDF